MLTFRYRLEKPGVPGSVAHVSTPLVYVVILNWNNYDATAQCVRSVREQSYGAYRILVIDNGSTDGSAEQLRTHNDIELIQLDQNLGYTGGNNIALAHAFAEGAAYVWLLNNDALAEPDTLATLVERAETDATIGLVSPLLRSCLGNRDVETACAGFDLSIPSYQSTADLTEADQWHSASPRCVALYGTALLIRRALWQRIGALDDAYFAYWEDIDYSIRSVLAGFRNVTVFGASVGHEAKPSQTAPETINPYVYYYVVRNELLLWRKHTPGIRYLKAALWSLAAKLRQIVGMPSHDAGIEAVLAGLWDGWRGVGGPRGNRRMPQPLRGMMRRWPHVWLAVLNRA
jgi:hypothetical protein